MGNLLDRARWFASYYHRNQKYGDERLPYTRHLEAVENVLIEFGWGLDSDMLAAAWLHDVIEDCQPEVTAGVVRAKFGSALADLVSRVTDEPGKNRAERHTATYPKIAGNERATALKLADRIANVRHCGEPRRLPNESACQSAEHRSLFSMYLKEYPEFRLALYETRPATEAMWRELDKLMGRGGPPHFGNPR